jgi:hypothetical protein
VDDRVHVALTWFAIACGGEVAVALLYFPALRAAGRVRVALWAASSVTIASAPLLIPPYARLPRCLAAVLAVTVVAKLWDLHRGAARGRRPTFGPYLAFLPNIFSLVHRKLDGEPRPSRKHLVRTAAAAGVMLLPAGILFAQVFRFPWGRYGFAAEHAAKVVSFFLVLVPLTTVAGAAWQFAGGRGLWFMNNPFAARTPADFWRRYNRPVRQFLDEDLFVPAGGRRSPLLGTVAVFLASAAIHEYVFSIALGRVQGYQTGFFLLQGFAVAATLRVKPRGPAAVAAVAMTFAFNVATAVLFFASVNGVVPFYVNRMPLSDRPTTHASPPPADAPSHPCDRAYDSNPGSDAKGGLSNNLRESSSSAQDNSATSATRRFGASHRTLSRKFSSSKHCAYAHGPTTMLRTSSPHSSDPTQRLT